MARLTSIKLAFTHCAAWIMFVLWKHRPEACLTQVPHEAQVLAVQVVAAVGHDHLCATLCTAAIQTSGCQNQLVHRRLYSNAHYLYCSHGTEYPQARPAALKALCTAGLPRERLAECWNNTRLRSCTTGAAADASAGKPGAAGTWEPCRAREFTT